MKLREVAILGLLLFAGLMCTAEDGEQHRAVSVTATKRAESERLNRLVRRVREVERRARSLSSTWAAVRGGYLRAQQAFTNAEAAYQRAARVGDQASSSFSTAREAWEQARWRWELYQQLVLVAAAIDAHNLDRFRALTGDHEVSSLDCSTGMSTAAFRDLLMAGGLSLKNIDIDHIVPLSLGGADHPANYQLLDRSLNRSLQDSWGPGKCRLAGRKCAGAIAISRKCGTYEGPEF